MVSPLALQLAVFTRLTKDDREALAAATSNAREVAPRRDLIREGERPKAAHLVLSGWGCRYKTLPDGRRQILAFLLPGDCCGRNAFLLGEMDHGIAAITRMRIAEVTREEMEALMLGHQRIAQALRWEQLVQESIQREWTLNIGQRTAYERIAHLLTELFVRLRIVGMTQEDGCDFPLTQTDIADASGLTAVHVNRTVQELRREGLVELQHKRLRIPDLEGLMEAAVFNPAYLHIEHEGRRHSASVLA